MAKPKPKPKLKKPLNAELMELAKEAGGKIKKRKMFF